MSVTEFLKHKRVFILSPHADDAVLSCGQLLTNLAGQSDCTVVNVCTAAHTGPYTISARRYVSDCGGWGNAADLASARRREDRQALSRLKVKIVDLKIADALFRRKPHPGPLARLIPELSHYYPTYRFHVIGRISPEDSAPARVTAAIRSLVSGKRTLILAPYGIGGHVDHRMVRQAAFAAGTDVILYEDYPYSIRTVKASISGFRAETLPVDARRKTALISLYQTQLASLFPDHRIPLDKERYFFKQNL